MKVTVEIDLNGIEPWQGAVEIETAVTFPSFTPHYTVKSVTVAGKETE